MRVIYPSGEDINKFRCVICNINMDDDDLDSYTEHICRSCEVNI